MFPAMLAVQVPLASQPSINAHYSNVRTRALNNILFWSVHLTTVAVMQPILDSRRLSRRARGIYVCIFLTCLVVGVWVGELVWLRAHQAPRDWTDAEFASFIAIYLFQGMLYQIYWIFIQRVVGALSNSPHLLARCKQTLEHLPGFQALTMLKCLDSGFLKACIASDTCIAFGINSVLPPFEYEAA